MYDYYCKKCNNIVGKWNNTYKWYNCPNFCYYAKSKKFDSIYFLDCKNCNKFVGIECWHVCKNCFGKKEIFGEKNLFNWFLEYEKIVNYDYFCKICNKTKYRSQCWFFEELTFYK